MYRLINKTDIYAKVEIEDALGDISRKPRKIKSYVPCKIIPLGNKTITTKILETESNRHQFKFIFRYLSLKGIKKDWYFMFNGCKYQVIYWNEDFKHRKFIEVFTELIQE